MKPEPKTKTEEAWAELHEALREVWRATGIERFLVAILSRINAWLERKR